jgi:hypothetical protein
MQRGEIYWLEFGPPVEKMDEETGEPILDADSQVVMERKRRPIIIRFSRHTQWRELRSCSTLLFSRR